MYDCLPRLHILNETKTFTYYTKHDFRETVLGPEFVFEALRTDPTGSAAAEGRTLRFLANVDPVDVARATNGESLNYNAFNYLISGCRC